MATLSKSNIVLDGNWEVRTLTEAASQSFKAMDPVILSSSKVAIAAAAGSDFTNAVEFLGFAAQDASGTTDNPIKVYVAADKSATIRTAVDHATPSSAVTAVTQIGTNYVGNNSATGGFVIEIDTTTNANFQVVEIDPNYAVGERYGWVKVRPITSASGYSFE